MLVYGSRQKIPRTIYVLAFDIPSLDFPLHPFSRKYSLDLRGKRVAFSGELVGTRIQNTVHPQGQLEF
jgi:hypothetical protein